MKRILLFSQGWYCTISLDNQLIYLVYQSSLFKHVKKYATTFCNFALWKGTEDTMISKYRSLNFKNNAKTDYLRWSSTQLPIILIFYALSYFEQKWKKPPYLWLWSLPLVSCRMPQHKCGESMQVRNLNSYNWKINIGCYVPSLDKCKNSLWSRILFY